MTPPLRCSLVQRLMALRRCLLEQRLTALRRCLLEQRLTALQRCLLAQRLTALQRSRAILGRFLSTGFLQSAYARGARARYSLSRPPQLSP